MSNDKIRRTSTPRVRITRPVEVEEPDGGSTQDSSNSGYAVGYKRPPMHSRFKPGVSGNPRGRRKRYLNIREEIQQVFLRKLAVQDGLKKQHIAKIVILFNRLLNDGLKGDRGAVLAAAKMAGQFGVYDMREKFELDLSMLTKEERELCSKALQILRGAQVWSSKSGLGRLKI